MIRAFIFDLDGVITDTAEYHFQAWKRLADEEGIPFTRQDNEALRGVPRRESLNRLLKGKPVSNEQARRWMARKNEYYKSSIAHMTPDDILPGVLKLLTEIRAAEIKIAIASASKNASIVIERLRLADKLDVMCDGYSVEHHKPAPDLFLQTAMDLGILPGGCIIVEDAEAGIAASRAAGMLSIGLGPVERVGEADLILPSLEGVTLQQILEHVSAISQQGKEI
jgi:kojibiose phosphorylase